MTSSCKAYLSPAPGSLEEITLLITRVRPPEWRSDYPTTVDLEELFQDASMPKNSRLWSVPGGSTVAYALVHFPYNNLSFEIDPSCRTTALEDEILAWALSRMRAHYGTGVTQQTLDASCRLEDTAALAFFTRHGFAREEVESLAYLAELTGAPPAPVLPAGFSIRPLDGSREVEAALALHQASFGTENFTLEERVALMNTAAYLPSLDLVAVAPDGRLAGGCICSLEEAGGTGGTAEGYTDPVYVHPDFQRLGLAKALLLEGMTGLYELGVHQVRLGTSSDNPGMQRAAEAAGFRVMAQRAWFSKSLNN